MAIISNNPALGTTEQAIASRIVIDWNPITNDGNVAFHYDRMVRKTDGTVLERGYLGQGAATIGDLIANDYVVVHPVTGDEVVVPGWQLMASIKAATDLVYEGAVVPAPPKVASFPAADLGISDV